MKKCSRCKIEKLPEEFGKSKATKDGLNCYCSLCIKERRIENKEHMNALQRKYAQKHKEKNNKRSSLHYYANRDTILEEKRAWSKQNRPLIRKKLHGKKQKAVDMFGNICNICGNTYPFECFDFHHIDPTTKEKAIQKLMSCSWKTLEVELAKCILVCSNCHRTIHFKEYNK